MTPNQLHKASGSSLPFKEWLNREKEKQGLDPSEKLDLNAAFNKSIQETLDTDFANASGVPESAAMYKPEGEGKTIMGINKKVLVISAVLIVAAVAYSVYKKKKG